MKTRNIVILSLASIWVITLVALLAYRLGTRKNFPSQGLMPQAISGILPPMIQTMMGLQVANPLPLNDTAPDLPGTFVSFPEGAFKIRIPEWWKPVDTKKFSGEPYRFTNIQSAFASDKNTCALIYSGKPLAPNGQSHFINQVKLDSSVQVVATLRNVLLSHAPQNPATSTPGITFMGGGMNEPYLPYEFASFYLTGDDLQRFYLISTDDKPLDKNCESEARSIVKTYTREFATSTLADAKGTIFVGLDVPNPGILDYSLFFVADLSGTAIKKIVSFPRGSTGFIFSAKNQSISYIANGEYSTAVMRAKVAKDGTIETKELASNIGGLTVPRGSIIVDFLTAGNTTYYLTGPTSCTEYKGACKTNLFAYDEQAGKITQTAKDLDLSAIVGPSPDGSEILLASYFGDAGCWSSTYTRVRVSDGYATGAGSFSGCYDDNGSSQSIAQERGRDELTSRFGGAPFKTMLTGLTIQNGVLEPRLYKNDGADPVVSKASQLYRVSPTNLRIERNF